MIKKLSTTRIILLSFLIVIITGSILLVMPVSSANGHSVGYIDALFTATTATCVTGLVTLPTFSTWSLFGQAVILLLIQIGGLGVITVVSGFMILIHRRMGIGDRLLIQEAFNLNTLSGMVRFVKKVLIGTLAVEGVGALLYMTVFIPRFGMRGIWISVFNSVSAFCNAGIDIISADSLCGYATHPVVNLVTSVLIILGGLGYIVWWDVIRVLGLKKGRRRAAALTLHSKIVLSSTAVLLLGGGVLFLIFEYNNPLTMGNNGFFDKLQLSLFQSVTTRTAGFATIPQESLSNPSALLSLVLMFIGGSPVGTAGGIKTVTVAVLIMSAMATVKNKSEVTVFDRNVSRTAVSKAVAVCCVSFLIMLISTISLSAVSDAPVIDILYETVSATATVGLTRALTSSLNVWGKIIIIFTMYFGRIGPITLALALNRKKEKQNLIKNPTEEISVG